MIPQTLQDLGALVTLLDKLKAGKALALLRVYETWLNKMRDSNSPADQWKFYLGFGLTVSAAFACAGLSIVLDEASRASFIWDWMLGIPMLLVSVATTHIALWESFLPGGD